MTFHCEDMAAGEQPMAKHKMKSDSPIYSNFYPCFLVGRSLSATTMGHGSSAITKKNAVPKMEHLVVEQLPQSELQYAYQYERA